MKRRELAKALLEQIDRMRTQLARLRRVVMMKLSAKKTKAKECSRHRAVFAYFAAQLKF
jgi:hypothetical protein